MFNDLAFRDELNLSAVNSINWARVMAQIVYYVWAAVALGAPDRAVSFAVPTGNFGNVYAGYAARQMGLPVERLIVGSNRNDILTRFFTTGRMQIEAVQPSLEPEHGHPGLQQPRAAAVRSLRPRRRGAVRRRWPASAATASSPSATDSLRAARALFDAYRCDDQETLAAIAGLHRQTGELIDPHSAIGVTAAHLGARGDGVPMVALATAHPAKFPDAVEQATGVRPPLPPAPGRSLRPAGAGRDAAQRSARRAGLHPQPPPEGCRLMAGVNGMQVTRLGNGLTVATDRMAGVETASLGVWVGVGTRHEPRAINGVAHLLEHMAFKGTETTQRPRHRRGDRGGRRPAQRLHLARAYRLLRPRAGRRRAAGARYPGRHPPALDAGRRGAESRAHGGAAGDRPGRGHARRHRLRLLPGDRLSQPGAGPAGAGHGRHGDRHAARADPRLSAPALYRREHGPGGGGAGRP